MPKINTINVAIIKPFTPKIKYNTAAAGIAINDPQVPGILGHNPTLNHVAIQ